MSTPSKSITKRSEPWHPGVRGLESFASSSLWRERSRLIREFVVEPTNSGFVQFFRSGVVGAVAFGCDFGVLALATDVLGLHYLISGLFGFGVGVIVNYWLSVRWVFNKRKFSRASVQFGLFALIGVVGVGINELIMWLFTEYVGWHYLVSKLAATVVVYLWNFSIRKALIF